jgi:hypothetical protein
VAWWRNRNIYYSSKDPSYAVNDCQPLDNRPAAAEESRCQAVALMLAHDPTVAPRAIPSSS